LVRPIDRDARAVLRFWRVAEVARLPRAGAPPSDTPVTLYVVMATNEELGDVLHFVLYVRTASDYRAPLVLLGHALSQEHVRAVPRDDAPDGLRLVW
jgi:hypothetical protein